MKYRLRYAPSPTGFLHIGNARTALMNFLFAKHYGGDFIIRVEDTDIERFVENSKESQFENLEWLKIFADESYLKPKQQYGAYVQSKKIKRYLEFAEQLISENKAYKCFCTPQELEVEREEQIKKGIISTKYSKKCLNIKNTESLNYKNKPYNIRFKVPENKIYAINDMVRGRVEFNSKEIGDFVIIKSNGIATYNFAVVIDDFDMKISHVVRGEEHISNTPKQCMLYEAFNWEEPVFCHLTLIVDESKKKLSKRSGNSIFFISQYKEKGFLPEAVFNYIALLGWSPKEEREIFSIEELILIFDDKRFSKSPSTFDMKKMQWINSQWMKKISDEQFLLFIKRFIDEKRYAFKIRSSEWTDAVLLLFKKEIDFGQQINDHLDIFFDKSDFDNETKIILTDFFDYKEMIIKLKTKFETLINFDEESIKEIIKQIGVEFNKKGKELFMPIRICTTLSQHGPELAKTISLIGKEKILKNMKLVV